MNELHYFRTIILLKASSEAWLMTFSDHLQKKEIL